MTDSHPASRHYRLVCEKRIEGRHFATDRNCATHVTIQVRRQHGWVGPTLDAVRERSLIDSIEMLIQSAYDAGRADAQKRMRDALGV